RAAAVHRDRQRAGLDILRRERQIAVARDGRCQGCRRSRPVWWRKFMRLKQMIAVAFAALPALAGMALPAGAQTAETQTMGTPATQTPFRPVAVVNETPITGFDLAQRVQILTALGYG